MSLSDDALAAFIRELRLEADTRGDLHATLHPCVDGRMIDHAAEAAFPSAGSMDFAWSFSEED